MSAIVFNEGQGGAIVFSGDAIRVDESTAVRAEAAAAAAAASAANFGVPTIAALRAVVPITGGTAFLTDPIRQGLFVWRLGNYTTAVANDPTGAVYVKANTISAATGAWVRADVGILTRPFGIDLAWFGVVGDDATDNTTAMNAAIAFINAFGGAMGVIVPEGISRIGDCTRITVSGVYFAARSNGALKGTDTAGMLHIGDAGGAVTQGFGFSNVGWYGNSNAAQKLIQLENTQQIVWDNNRLEGGVATFVRAGLPAGGQVSGLDFNGLRGRVPNVSAALFELVNGAGFNVNLANVYNEAFEGGGSAVSGRNVFNCFEGSWNTLDVKGSFFFLFDHGLGADIQSGKSFGDIAFFDTRFDEANVGFSFVAQAGGAIGNVDISDVQVTGKRGAALQILGGGEHKRYSINALVAREMHTGGIEIYSPVNELHVTNCTISQVAEPCEFVGGIAGTVLTITARTGFPGGTLKVGSVISGAGVAVGTTITSVAPNNAVTGAFGVSISQTVAPGTAMTTGTGRSAAFYLATGSSDVKILGNTFGTKIDGLMGPGNAVYGMLIEGGTRVKLANNSCDGTIANESIAGLTDSESDTAWFPYAVALTSSGGGAFGAATATGRYQRTGRKVKVSITGTITTVGAATGFLLPSLPFAAAATPAVEYTGTGIQVGATVSVSAAAGAGSALVVRYDGAATATVTGGFSVSLEYQI
jgi:hypothetical protein